jgi:hypothetical protein
MLRSGFLRCCGRYVFTRLTLSKPTVTSDPRSIVTLPASSSMRVISPESSICWPRLIFVESRMECGNPWEGMETLTRSLAYPPSHCGCDRHHVKRLLIYETTRFALAGTAQRLGCEGDWQLEAAGP